MDAAVLSVGPRLDVGNLFRVELEYAFSTETRIESLALRFRVDIVTYFPELLWSFEQTPFPLLSLIIGCRWITESVDLLAGQVKGLRPSLGASLLGWRHSF